MSDEDLIIKLPPPDPPRKKIDLATALSIVALVASGFSAAFTGGQWWENHLVRKLTESAQAPLIEVQKQEPRGKYYLKVPIKNIGKTTAYGVKMTWDWVLGMRELEPQGLVFYVNYRHRAPSRLYTPDIPVGGDAESGVYIPELEELLRYTSYDPRMFFKIKAEYEYRDGLGNEYHVPWCVISFASYQPSAPSWTACAPDEERDMPDPRLKKQP